MEIDETLNLYNAKKWYKFSPIYGDLARDIGLKNVLVAGGAVRDLLLSKRIRDFDVYAGVQEFPETSSYFSPTGRKFVRDPNGKDYIDDNMRVYQYYQDGIAVDLMLVKGITTYDYILTRFDTNICKCWYSERGFHRTMAFNAAISCRTDFFAAESKHIDKLREKFPEYEFKRR